jgi:type II secretory pathway pseudopilin PulG
MLKNEKGYALVLVIITMLIMAILGTVLISVSTSQVREAVKQQERVQAHYLAYYGAKATVDWIMSGNTIPQGSSTAVTLDNGSFTVNVDTSNQDQIIIEAQGTVNGYSETIYVTLTRQGGGSTGGFPFPTDTAVFSISDGNSGNPVISLTGSSHIEGNIGTNSSVANTIVFGPSTSVDGNLYSMIDPGDPDSDGWEAPDPNDYSEWVSTIGYSGGSRVVYNGAVYQARHHTTGAQPGLMSSPWQEITNLWRNFNIYDANDEAWYDGDKYRANWNSQNAQPDISNAWVSVAGLPFTQVMGDILLLVNPRAYPTPTFPEFPTNLTDRGNFSTPAEQTYLINSDGYYGTISITSNRILNIDMNGGNRIIRVGNLNISQGHINMINVGENSRLALYVENSFTLLGDSTINNGGMVSNLMMYYKGLSDPDIGGNTRYVGNYFAESAGLEIKGSNGIIGHIITLGSSVIFSGNARLLTRVLYAPNAHVVIGGSGAATGSIIANSILVDGNGRVYYAQPDMGLFPIEIFPIDGNGSNGGGNGNNTITWINPQWSGGNN